MEEKVENRIKEILSKITDLDGKVLLSEASFITVYNMLRGEYSLHDELADTAGLIETDTHNCWSQKGGVGYFRKGKYGFYDIRVENFMHHE